MPGPLRFIRIPRAKTLMRKITGTNPGPSPKIVFVLLIAAFIVLSLQHPDSNSPVQIVSANKRNTTVSPHAITCRDPRIIDGDTFDCDGRRIRLEGIDTPEMPGHCNPGRDCTGGDPYAAKKTLASLSRGIITCTPVKTDHYGRIVARCANDREDLSCAMLGSGHAVRRYADISCPI